MVLESDITPPQPEQTPEPEETGFTPIVPYEPEQRAAYGEPITDLFEPDVNVIVRSPTPDFQEVQAKLVENLEKGIPFAEILNAAPTPEAAEVLRRQVEFSQNPAEGNAWQRYIHNVVNNPFTTNISTALRTDALQFIHNINRMLGETNVGIDYYIQGTTSNGLAMYGSSTDIRMLTVDGEDKAKLHDLLHYQSPPRHFNVSTVAVPELLHYSNNLGNNSPDQAMKVIHYQDLISSAFYPSIEELSGSPAAPISIINRNLLLRNMQSLPSTIQQYFYESWANEMPQILKGTFMHDNPRLDDKISLPLRHAEDLLIKKMEDQGYTAKEIDRFIRDAGANYNAINAPHIALTQLIFNQALGHIDSNFIQKVEKKIADQNSAGSLALREFTRSANMDFNPPKVETSQRIVTESNIPINSNPQDSFIYNPDDERSLAEIFVHKQHTQAATSLEQSTLNIDRDLSQGEPLGIYSFIKSTTEEYGLLLAGCDDSPEGQSHRERVLTDLKTKLSWKEAVIKNVTNERFKQELYRALAEAKAQFGI